MSSLVHKQRQQVAVSAAAGGVMDANKAQIGNEIQQKQPTTTTSLPAAKKGLSRRSVSFEKFLLTAFHIRLACAKCSRESLKLCLEMLIMRSRLIAEHLMAALCLVKLVQLAHKWNTAVLEIANVVIPKWQIRVRHIVDTAILQRENRRRQQHQHQEKKTETKATAVVTPIKRDLIEEEEEEVRAAVGVGEEKQDVVAVVHREAAVASATKAEKVEKATQTSAENIVELDKGRSWDDAQMRRLGLTIAVIACVVFLALQIVVGVALLLSSVRGLPWGFVFQVGCVGYIAYLLLSICDFSRLNMTTCNYGKSHNNSTMQRRVMNAATAPGDKAIRGGEGVSESRAAKVTVKVVQLSFIEKTMSKVKLL